MNEDPYYDGGTRGAHNVATSKEAADADLTNGVSSAAQRYVLVMAKQAGERGVTVAELREKSGSLHHGRVSSAVTKQHIAGRLVALTERRGNAGVYVLPEYANGREQRPYRRQSARLTIEAVENLLSEHGLLRTLDGRQVQCSCGEDTVHSTHEHRRHVARKIVELSRGES